MGDPAGIGPELTLLAWRDRTDNGIPAFAAFSDPSLLATTAASLGMDLPIREISEAPAALDVFDSALPVVPVALPTPAHAGQPTPQHGPAVVRSIEQAVQAVMKGDAAGLATNPIAKSVLYEAGFKHPGHTEFLAELGKLYAPGSATHPVMMLACDELKVVPATIHIPLSAVAEALTPRVLSVTLRVTHAALISDFGIAQPRIAVAGLNPHAGENGTIGSEDATVIAPVIAELQAEGFDITGPHPADTLFHAAARATYHCAVAMYHDQALIPIKTLAFDSAVNVTLGLPFVRTSPDHGTAFDIAGTGRALPSSLVASLKLADQMARRRNTAAAPHSATGPEPS